MKKILSIFAAVLLCGFISCNNEKTATETKEENSAVKKNLESSHIVSKAFDTGDPSMIDSAVASDFVDHTDRGDMNRDSLKAMISMMRKTFPDMKMELIKELADNDYVFSLMRFTGTSEGQMGMPKGPYDMQAIQMVRFRDGKAVEHWEYMEPREMMKMMPQQQPAEGKK
jgi:predicted SnoaL-like aldol condensation-catalyzing enzyme